MSDDPRFYALEKDLNSLGGKVRRIEAVLFGEHADESGGLRGDILAMKTWLKALTTLLAVLLIMFGPERIASAVKFLK